MNAGSRWLRNVTDASNPWVAKNYQSEVANINQNTGNEQCAAKFMKVDGVVNVIDGDSEMVTIKARGIRKEIAGNQMSNQLENISESSSGGKIIAVDDSKRKRVEEELQGIIIGVNDKHILDGQIVESKNGHEVGSGLQAHQTLRVL